MAEQTDKRLELFFDQLKRKRFLKIMFRWLKWGFFAFVLLIIIAWFLLQNSRFQNWAVNQTTDYLSEKLETTVSLKKIDLHLFTKLVLEEFYVEDLRGDTLIYSETLKTSLSANLLGILSNSLDIDDIYLNNAKVFIRRDSGEHKNNLEQLLVKLSSKEKKKKKKSSSSNPFFLDIDALYLNNVHFLKEDIPSGNRIEALLRSGKVIVESISLEDNNYVLGEVLLESPDIALEDFPETLLPPLPDSLKIESTPKDSTDKLPVLVIRDFNLLKGKFRRDDFRKSPAKKVDSLLDFDHLRLENINLDIVDFQFQSPLELTGTINHISLEESCGFVLDKLAANQLKIDSRSINLEGLELLTPYSVITDTLRFQYREFKDFKEFHDKVRMSGDFKKSKIALKDIIVFAPNLGNNAFFRQNKEAVVELDGKIYGKINNLSGRDLVMRLGKGLRLKGRFSSRNLSVKNEEMLNLKLDYLQTDIKTLRLLVPNFNPPDNFDKLGKLNFNGNFDGFFIDFVAHGELNTDLGSAVMDMHMDLRKGRDKANYSGNLSLNDFDLKTWSGNDNLGKISFNSKVLESEGLTIETVNTRIEAQIDQFSFKEYTYQNVALNGELNQNLFDGKLNIQDENIDFSFDGSIDFSDTIPFFDFQADIKKADLYALNIIEQNLVFAGQVDLRLRDANLSRIQGEADIYNFQMVRDDSLTYAVDTIELASILAPNGQKLFRLNSEVMDVQLRGLYDIRKVPESFAQYLEKNHERITERFNIKSKGDSLGVQKFDYKVNIHDTKNLTDLIDAKIDTIKNLAITGHLDLQNDSIRFDLSLPVFEFDNMTFDDFYVLLEGQGTDSELELGVYHTQVNDQHFEPLSLVGNINKDTLNFGLTATNFTNVLDNLQLNGQLTFVDEYFQIRFLTSQLVILKEEWEINEDNYLRIGKNKIKAHNFSLRQGKKNIKVHSPKENGLVVDVNGFDLSLIDELWDYDKLDFSGPFNLEASVEDLFQLKKIKAVVSADTMRVNRDDWGALYVNAEMNSLKEKANIYMSITRKDQQLTAEGYFTPPAARAKERSPKIFNINAHIRDYPMHIAEYWLGDGISNTVGTFDAEATVSSVGKGPSLNGEVRVKQMETTINYTQTRYYVESGTMLVNDEFLFDASNNYIKDKYGNTALLTGGIRHDQLKNLRLNARIDATQFLILDTDKEDNETYYGHCVGSGNITFEGPFNKANISIDAVTGEGSRLIMPLTSETKAGEISFIKLINKDDIQKEEKEKQVEPKGIELDLNVSFNEQAEVLLVFDERTGDIIRGRGRGDVQMFFPRSGEVTMYGNYDIEEGEYLFTLYNIINKPFVVKPGGTIRWTGDPFNATIDFSAEYKGLNTSLYNLIVEYLNTEEQKAQARSSTEVDLTMHLTGQLIAPEIQFDIVFPQLDSDIKSFTDSKMRILNLDQNELNRQVFGLLVIGSFLPSGEGVLAGSEGTIGINTLSEMVTNQLSNYLTELLSEVFTDVGFISGVDFDINYNRYQANDYSGENLITNTGNEIGLDLKSRFFDDRLSVNIGGNIDWGTGTVASESGAFLAGEFVLEYVLTTDRRFKIKIYQLSDQSINFGRRNKSGVGLSFRKEYDTFGELLRGLRKNPKDLRD